ncbi:sensor histidine kinase [Glaciibacter superstes]|uniref:sensor histidine kinase n=1 Tax=Glaciibacter superstes TaxID=501023 RepID=UPI0003B428CA|nr:histidine kinase [Glaciibacter superstes]
MTGAAAYRADGLLREIAGRVPVWTLVSGLVVSMLAIGFAIGLPLGATHSVLSRVAVVAFVVGMTALALTGAVLLQQDVAAPMGWWLVAAGLTGLLSRLSIGAIVAAVGQGADVPAVILWTTNWSWVPAQFALFELLLRFPTGRLPNRWWRIVEIGAILWFALTVAVTALLPGPLGTEPLSHVHNSLGWSAASVSLNAALGPAFLAIPVLTALCAGALLWRWVRGGELERQQLRWILTAAVLLAVTAALAGLGGALQLAEAAAYVFLPAVVAVAVLQHGLWSLGRAVRKTLVYAAATAVLAGCYLALVLLLDNAATPVIAALFVGVLALPVRNFFHWLLELLLYGERGDPDRAVEMLSERLHRDSGSLANTVAAELARSLRLPYVALLDADGMLVADAGIPGTEGLRLPLQVNGIDSGALIAHERAAGEGLGAKDRRLLARVAAQAGLAVRAEGLRSDLQQSYARLASVRDDERARLQRDLHDGIGPSLAGIVLQSEAARNLSRGAAVSSSEGRRLDAVLESIGSNAEEIVHDIRRIIDELRPATLEAVGLRDALVDLANKLTPGLRLHADITQRMPVLDQDAELSVFRMTGEAMRNVARHSWARNIWVRIDADETTLIVRVEDDGVGLGGSQPGVGMRSMRERAKNLGGTLTTGLRAGGVGTAVVAHIPLAGIRAVSEEES